ncbi:SGNH/GDSL hydrolase family protein [Arcticibacter tournemirensis]
MKGNIITRTVFFRLVLLATGLLIVSKSASGGGLKFFKSSDPHFQYTGRIDFSNLQLPRFWAPAVYVKVGFTGANCEIVVNDEVLYGKSHNYISVVIDDMPAKRIKLTGKVNRIKVAENLGGKHHTMLLCKSTESNIGYIEFAGIYCGGLWHLPKEPSRKIEFIGNSITCGTGSDTSGYKCGNGEWYDQHNAYMSYGPVTARALDARWQLTAFSGIGLMKSCCEIKVVMPDIFDKINLLDNKLVWDFKKFQPDVVTVCLGQNDGVQDSAVFCSEYLKFIHRLRAYYPSSTIICLSSPMADTQLFEVQKEYLLSISAAASRQGDRAVYSYFFSKRYHNGCGDHPSLSEHQQIAEELALFIKKVKHWE